MSFKEIMSNYELCVLDFIEKNVVEGTKEYFKHVGKCGGRPVEACVRAVLC